MSARIAASRHNWRPRANRTELKAAGAGGSRCFYEKNAEHKSESCQRPSSPPAMPAVGKIKKWIYESRQDRQTFVEMRNIIKLLRRSGSRRWSRRG